MMYGSMLYGPGYETAVHFPAALIVLLLFLAVWELAWKGVALWRAAQKRHLGWFVAILIINSIGLLPIIYLAFFNKRKKESARK